MITDKQKAIIWAREMLNNNNVILLDTETTGFDKDARICDLGVIDTNGKILIDILINPTIPMPERASQINGITDDMLKNSPKFSNIHKTIRQILNGKTIIAWNSSFDQRIVEGEFERLGLEKPNCKWVDAMPIYAKYANKSRNNRLCLAAKECGIIEEQSHRAVGDCIFTLKVIESMT